MNAINVTMFGATGRSGRHVLQRLLADGHCLRVVVRNSASLTEVLPPDKIVVGDARDPKAVRGALVGAEAVVSCLGMGDFSKPATDLSDATAAIVNGMSESGTQRILAIAAAGVLPHESGGLRSEHDSLPHFVHVAAEQARMYRNLAATRLKWTLLCPGFLVDAPNERYVTAVEAWPGKGANRTGYMHLADAIARGFDNSSWYGRRIGIAAVEHQ